MSCNFTASTNKYKVDLVLQIYMKLPQSLTNLTFSGGLLDTSSVSIYSNTSGVDTISHFLLLALASTQHGRNWTDQMREFEAAARKLAATHPLLLLRNLPLLAAGMKGRTDFDFSFFRYAFDHNFKMMILRHVIQSCMNAHDTLKCINNTNHIVNVGTDD